MIQDHDKNQCQFFRKLEYAYDRVYPNIDPDGRGEVEVFHFRAPSIEVLVQHNQLHRCVSRGPLCFHILKITEVRQEVV